MVSAVWYILLIYKRQTNVLLILKKQVSFKRLTATRRQKTQSFGETVIS